MTSTVADARLTDTQRRVLEALPDYDPSCPGVPQHQITSDEIEMPRKGWVTAIKVAQITGLRRSSVQRSLNILCNLQLAELCDKGWLQGIYLYRRTPAGTAALEAMRRAR